MAKLVQIPAKHFNILFSPQASPVGLLIGVFGIKTVLELG